MPLRPHLFWQALTVSLTFLLVGAGRAQAAGASPAPGAALDARRDPRLAQRVRLSAEGIPVSRVLRGLGESTGLTLRVDGTAGDERLVAFVPEAPVEEVLERIAELYRLQWYREGSGERPAYRLRKLPSTAREEAALRSAAFHQVFERLRTEMERPVPPPAQAAPAAPDRAAEGAWKPVYPLVLPLVSQRLGQLFRDGYLYVPVRSLPPPQQEALVARMQPIVRAQHELFQSIRRQIDQQARPGAPRIGGPGAGGVDEPAPDSRDYTITLDLSLREELGVRAGLRTGAGTVFGWFDAQADSLEEPGLRLYQDRVPRTPERPGGVGAPAGSDRFGKAVPVAPAPVTSGRKDNWMEGLKRLSAASGVSVYTDCYSNYLHGIDQHPRSSLAVSGTVSPAAVLDSVCYPTGASGTRPLTANSFWWRSGNAALVRSRRWLWESQCVLPAALLDRLTASARRTGQVDAADLPAIAGLNALQVQAAGFVDHRMDTWRSAVQVPSLLSLGARIALLGPGIRWSALTPPDQALARPHLPALPAGSEPDYSARLESTVVPLAGQGGTMVRLFFHAAVNGPEEQSVVYFPLPGVAPEPQLPPRGLEIVRLPSIPG